MKSRLFNSVSNAANCFLFRSTRVHCFSDDDDLLHHVCSSAASQLRMANSIQSSLLVQENTLDLGFAILSALSAELHGAKVCHTFHTYESDSFAYDIARTT